jgi:hypothetical protein
VGDILSKVDYIVDGIMISYTKLKHCIFIRISKYQELRIDEFEHTLFVKFLIFLISKIITNKRC